MSSVLTYDEIVRGLRAYGIEPARAEAQARQALGIPAPGIAAADIEKGALEKVHVKEGDRIMRSLGFEVIRLSQYRRAKITEGVPDRRYYHVRRRVVLWWEAKSETGEQRTAQEWFQSLCDAVGDPYVLGTVAMLEQWLIENEVAVRQPCGRMEPVTFRAE